MSTREIEADCTECFASNQLPEWELDAEWVTCNHCGATFAGPGRERMRRLEQECAKRPEEDWAPASISTGAGVTRWDDDRGSFENASSTRNVLQHPVRDDVATSADGEEQPDRPKPPARRADRTFFSERGIMVSTTRLIFPKATYAMANVTSVAIRAEPSKAWQGVLMAAAGLAGVWLTLDLLPNGAGSISFRTVFLVLCGLLAAVGMLGAILAKPTFHIEIGSASGESDALETRERHFAECIVNAINDAIVDRG